MIPIHRENRPGYSLIELMVAMASSTVLLGGLASTVFLAGRSLDSDDSKTFDILNATETLDDLTIDLRNALSFSEQNPTSLSFTVPDRDSDDTEETMRYSWSGTSGDPLFVQVDGGVAVEVVDDVAHLSLKYLERQVTGTGFAQGVLDAGGPVAHWTFDDGSGNTATDASENENHGKLKNQPVWVSGFGREALQFDGLNDYVVVNHDDSMSIETELTITAWLMGMEWQFRDYDSIVYKGKQPNACNYNLVLVHGRPTFAYYHGGWREFYAPFPLLTNVPYHVAATFTSTGSNNSVHLYVNGAQVLSTTTSCDLIVNSQDLTIGNSPYGEYWNGYLDGVRVYDRALTAEEIIEVMNDPVP